LRQRRLFDSSKNPVIFIASPPLGDDMDEDTTAVEPTADATSAAATPIIAAGPAFKKKKAVRKAAKKVEPKKAKKVKKAAKKSATKKSANKTTKKVAGKVSKKKKAKKSKR
jgi:RNA polymerase primary sigma factor